jgi:hypothetical protein
VADAIEIRGGGRSVRVPLADARRLRDAFRHFATGPGRAVYVILDAKLANPDTGVHW